MFLSAKDVCFLSHSQISLLFSLKKGKVSQYKVDDRADVAVVVLHLECSKSE